MVEVNEGLTRADLKGDIGAAERVDFALDIGGDKVTKLNSCAVFDGFKDGVFELEGGEAAVDVVGGDSDAGAFDFEGPL